MALEPTTETAPVEAPPADLTLAEHQAKFYPKAAKGNDTPKSPDVVTEAGESAKSEKSFSETARNDKGQFQKAEKERHRAKSQDASAEDVPRIRELTAKLRAAERERDELKQARASSPAATTPESAPATKTSGELSSGFTDPKPTIASLIAKGVEDPYAELPDAVLEWHDKKRAFEQAQRDTQTAESDRLENVKAEFLKRESEFKKSHPDYDEVLQKGPSEKLTPMLAWIILTDDNGNEMRYALAQQARDYRELLALTRHLDPENEDDVALAQRLISDRVQAATTGSAAPDRVSPSAPRPLNPVRTGPIRSGAELPGDEASLSEHEKVWGPKRRK